MHRRLIVGWVLAAVLAAPLLPATVHGWDQTAATSTDAAVAYQIDAVHSGDLPGDALTPPLTQLWATNLGGPVSYPLVVGSSVYVTVGNSGSYGTQLYALDARSGATLWGPVALGGTYFWSALTFDNGQVFALNYSGLLRAFDAQTGALAWSTRLPGQSSFNSPPTAAGGVIYTGGAGSGSTVYAVSEATGAVLWTAPVAAGSNSSPAVSATGVYVSYACEQTYDFAPGSGQLLWQHSTGCAGGGGCTPVLYGGKLYVRDSAGAAPVVLDGATGNQLGTFSAGPAPAFDGTLGFFLSGGTLQAIDQQSGATAWSFGGDGTLSSAPLVVNGAVYIGSSSGHLYGLNAVTGTLAFSTTLPAAVAAPDEQNVSQPLTGLAAGGGSLLVPASNWLVAFTSGTVPTPTGTPVPPTSTPVPPTNTTVPPTSTATNTAVPPTSTSTNTPVPQLTASGTTLTAQVRKALSNAVVATFADTKAGATAGFYAATITWGDGTFATAGTIAGTGPGTFAVQGSHTYQHTGTYSITVGIQAADGRTVSALSSVTIGK